MFASILYLLAAYMLWKGLRGLKVRCIRSSFSVRMRHLRPATRRWPQAKKARMKILVAVDGSSHTQKALDYLVANRAMFVDGNELIMVHVCTGMPGHVARHLSSEVVADYYTEENAKVLEPVKAFFEKQGITNFSTQGATATPPRRS